MQNTSSPLRVVETVNNASRERDQRSQRLVVDSRESNNYLRCLSYRPVDLFFFLLVLVIVYYRCCPMLSVALNDYDFIKGTIFLVSVVDQ